jgi:hypothetical protein
MAIAFGSSSVTGWAASNTTAIPKPASLGVGDMMVAFCYKRDISTISAPAGWTLIHRYNGGANANASGLFYKIATSDDTSASTFSFTCTGSSSEPFNGAIFRFTGTNLQIGNNSRADGVGTSLSTSGFTPVANSVFCIFTGLDDDTGTGVSAYAMANSNPSWTEDFDSGTTIGLDARFSGAYSAVRSSATATGNFSATSNASLTWTMSAVAIEEEISVAPPTLSITATLNAPTLTLENPLSVNAPTLSITATLNTPTLTYIDPLTIAPPTLDFTLTMNAPSKIKVGIWETKSKPTSTFTSKSKPTSIWTEQNKAL